MSGNDLREARNCTGKGSGDTLHFAFAPDLRRCPWSVISESTWIWLRAYGAWKTLSATPEIGDTGSQPLAWFQAITEITNTIAKQQETETRKLQAQSAKLEAHGRRT